MGTNPAAFGHVANDPLHRRARFRHEDLWAAGISELRAQFPQELIGIGIRNAQHICEIDLDDFDTRCPSQLSESLPDISSAYPVREDSALLSLRPANCI